MSGEVLFDTHGRPIESGEVLGHGQLHCSFECAAETGRRAWNGAQMPAIKTAMIPVSKMASKIQTSPIAKGAPRSRLRSRLKASARAGQSITPAM